MEGIIKELALKRLGNPLMAELEKNSSYVESAGQYQAFVESLKEKIGDSQEGRDLVLKLDEIVGEYSSQYGETAYVFGFHDGLDMGLDHVEEQKSKGHEPQAPSH